MDWLSGGLCSIRPLSGRPWDRREAAEVEEVLFEQPFAPSSKARSP